MSLREEASVFPSSTGQASSPVRPERGIQRLRVQVANLEVENCRHRQSRGLSVPSADLIAMKCHTTREPSGHREASSSFQPAQILRQGHLNPSIFPNFPYRLQSADILRDLMWLWVRPSVYVHLSLGLLRAVGSASESDTSNDMVYQPIDLFARESHFMSF